MLFITLLKKENPTQTPVQSNNELREVLGKDVSILKKAVKENTIDPDIYKGAYRVLKRIHLHSDTHDEIAEKLWAYNMNVMQESDYGEIDVYIASGVSQMTRRVLQLINKPLYKEEKAK